MRRLRDIVRDEDGFSAVEMIIAATMSLLVLGASYLLFETGMKAFAQIEAQTMSSREAAKCMTRLQRPVREASKISTATEYEMIFMADSDDDDKLERIRFYVPAGTKELKLDTTDTSGTVTSTSAKTISTSLRNRVDNQPLFTYLNREGVQLTGSDRTRASIIRLHVITEGRTTRPSPPYQVRTDVFLRNYTSQ